MKTKAIKTVLLFTLLAVLFGTLFASAILYTEEDGMKFDDLVKYKTVVVDMPLPMTYEATVRFPADFSGRGGVIFGSSSGGTEASLNLEIYEGGAPALCITDALGVKHEIVFRGANVYNGL